MIKYIFSFVICINLLINCVSVSYAQTPETPVLDSVSINQLNNRVVMGWSVQNPEMIDGYKIYRQIFNFVGVVDGSDMEIATIFGAENRFWEDTSTIYGASQPTQSPEYYQIKAFKGGLNSLNFSVKHASIYLYPVDFEPCYARNTIRWTQYKGWGNDLQGYRVFGKMEQSGNYQLLTTIAASDTFFVHPNLDEEKSYFYYIQAFSSNNLKTSTSNIQTAFSQMPRQPKLLDVTHATVEQNKWVNVSFEIDTEAVVKHYALLRSQTLNRNYDTVFVFPNTHNPLETNNIIPVSDSVYFYKLAAINSCNILYKTSEPISNICLKVVNDAALHQNRLDWNQFVGWTDSFETYKVYRTINQGNTELLSENTKTDNFYVDDVSAYANEQNFLACYYVEVQKIDGTSANICVSNVACAQTESLVFIPTAFNPLSVNEINRKFMPITSFINDYKLIIYDKWGNQVFTSTNASEGWNGYLSNGNLCMIGTYVYYLYYTTNEGNKMEKRGFFTVVY